MSYSVDREFESDTRPLFISTLSQVYPNCDIQFIDKKENADDSKTLDQRYSIDAVLTTSTRQPFTFQMKCRRHDKYEMFLKFQDILISLVKNTSTCSKRYPGEYLKCVAEYYMYAFSNEEKTDFLDWFIIDFSSFKRYVYEQGGFENIRSIKMKPFTEKNLTTENLVIPMSLVEPFILKRYTKSAIVNSSNVPDLVVIEW
jgi:hypothetical protein